MFSSSRVSAQAMVVSTSVVPLLLCRDPHRPRQPASPTTTTSNSGWLFCSFKIGTSINQ